MRGYVLLCGDLVYADRRIPVSTAKKISAFVGYS
jgi:hypothetical protein